MDRRCALSWALTTNHAVRLPHERAQDCRVRWVGGGKSRADPRRIGRNFADHAKELNNAVPTEPFFFLKPTTSYIGDGEAIQIPRGVVAHHEVELGVVIGRNACDINANRALDHVGGYGTCSGGQRPLMAQRSRST